MIVLPTNNDNINQSGRSNCFSLILACVILNELWFLEILEMNCTYMYLDDFRQFYLRKN